MRLFNLLVHISRLPCEAHPIQQISWQTKNRVVTVGDEDLFVLMMLGWAVLLIWDSVESILPLVTSHLLAQTPRENIQTPQANLKSHGVMVMVKVLLNWDSVESILPLSAAISPQNPPAETHRIHKHLMFLKYTFFMHSLVIQESNTTKFTISNVQVSWNQIVLEVSVNAQSHRRIFKPKFHRGIPLT